MLEAAAAERDGSRASCCIFPRMAQPAKSVLWVDDEAELLEPHRMFLRDKGFEVEKRFLPATETGSFGKIVDWSVNSSFGNLPVVTVNGAGNWQGLSCSTATLVELTPEGPRQLVTLPMTYDDSVAATAAGKKYTQVSGRIDNIQPGKSFDVVYFGSSKEFTEHYVRKGDAYVLASGGQSKVQRC